LSPIYEIVIEQFLQRNKPLCFVNLDGILFHA
jgi:hypothetical protein